MTKLELGQRQLMFEIYSESRTSLLEYMGKPREERRAHLNLNQPCVEMGGGSRNFRALLAMYLGTTCEPLGMKTGYLCHACGNEKCCNPEHLYWGTARDNSLDRYEHNPGIGKKVANTILSNDPDFYKKIGSHQGNKGVPKSDKHKKAISEGLLKHHADVTQR